MTTRAGARAQNECSPGKVSQKWAMSQYGVNLESDPGKQQCWISGTANRKLSAVFLHACANGLTKDGTTKQTLSEDGIICRASQSPERDCSLNDKQQKIYLGKTLTRRAAKKFVRAANCQGVSGKVAIVVSPSPFGEGPAVRSRSVRQQK